MTAATRDLKNAPAYGQGQWPSRFVEIVNYIVHLLRYSKTSRCNAGIPPINALALSSTSSPSTASETAVHALSGMTEDERLPSRVTNACSGAMRQQYGAGRANGRESQVCKAFCAAFHPDLGSILGKVLLFRSTTDRRRRLGALHCPPVGSRRHWQEPTVEVRGIMKALSKKLLNY